MREAASNRYVDESRRDLEPEGKKNKNERIA